MRTERKKLNNNEKVKHTFETLNRKKKEPNQFFWISPKNVSKLLSGTEQQQQQKKNKQTNKQTSKQTDYYTNAVLLLYVDWGEHKIGRTETKLNRVVKKKGERQISKTTVIHFTTRGKISDEPKIRHQYPSHLG